MSNHIGHKTTFWALVKKRITIPTLQRDYIYGAETEKTNEVLDNMLGTLKHALETGDEETLDFIYGSESKAKEFMPLDGQQRLTTLFLLHFYAALIAKDNEGNSLVSEDDFKLLGRFSYATRNCTVTFCEQMLIEKHEILSRHIANAQLTDKMLFASYLEDLDDFRGSFYTDPSVISMIVVLDRIHSVFHGMTDMWAKLTGNDCPINFYLLDFGIFNLSDDLYTKMNSRGKPLTTFEIFKAKLHKRILCTMGDKAETIAIKMDTDWMQFVWEVLGHTTELKLVDPAFMNILLTLFRAFDYISGNDKQQYTQLDDACLEHNMQSISKIKALENVLDVFSSTLSLIPQQILGEYTGSLQECIEGKLKNSGLLYLYAIYIGLYNKLESDEFNLRYRHVRNLINNSTNQIREVSMTGLLSDVKRVMQGKLTSVAVKLNKSSWVEEQEKDKHRDVWSTLFKYEDIEEINGSLQAFSANLNQLNMLDLSDTAFVTALTKRLDKAAYFFNAQLGNEYDRRSSLLSLGNYAQSTVNLPAYRYFGIIKTSWQNFTGFHRFADRDAIMKVIDKIDTTRPISDLVGNTSSINTEHWRYYTIKYASEITVGYRQPGYGYMFFPQVNDQHLYDDNQGYLDVCILQSSYFGKSNIAWRMINRLLDQKYIDVYNMYLDPHGGDRIRISKATTLAALDIQSVGWHVYGIEPGILCEVGLSITIVESEDQLEEDVLNCLVAHETGKDFVVEGAEILEKIAQKYPALKKSNQ